FIIFFFAYWDDDNRYQTLVMLQLIELMALVFTNGLKCRNKCEVASIPFFYFPTSLEFKKQIRRSLYISAFQTGI
ncbi:hypothetical protein, partial [Pseudanabaena cinerea]|uniref:hypothetical protein n=1 Tax=Pseudanabaena cinerea TaxID=2661616 RepID=UPI001A7E9E57